MLPAATITGSWQPGVSTGDVLRTMERLSAQELPRSMTYEWTELSYLQKQANKIEQFRDLRQNPFSAFVLGAALVFFVLAGLYESWSTPLAVILVVPMCLLSALAGIAFRGLDVNIFVQIGFVVLVGLACKNAILIVEFAKQQRERGKSRVDAIVSAAVTRLRPILMTSACFIHMVPPYFAAGAGAEMRRSLGTAVLWGAFGVTLFGIFLTPVFFYVVDWLTNRKGRPAAAPAATIREAPEWASPGVNNASNGVAAHASLHLMHPGMGGRRS
jgi:multidrug efflux pump